MKDPWAEGLDPWGGGAARQAPGHSAQLRGPAGSGKATGSTAVTASKTPAAVGSLDPWATRGDPWSASSPVPAAASAATRAQPAAAESSSALHRAAGPRRSTSQSADPWAAGRDPWGEKASVLNTSTSGIGPPTATGPQPAVKGQGGGSGAGAQAKAPDWTALSSDLTSMPEHQDYNRVVEQLAAGKGGGRNSRGRNRGKQKPSKGDDSNALPALDDAPRRRSRARNRKRKATQPNADAASDKCSGLHLHARRGRSTFGAASQVDNEDPEAGALLASKFDGDDEEARRDLVLALSQLHWDLALSPARCLAGPLRRRVRLKAPAGAYWYLAYVWVVLAAISAAVLAPAYVFCVRRLFDGPWAHGASFLEGPFFLLLGHATCGAAMAIWSGLHAASRLARAPRLRRWLQGPAGHLLFWVRRRTWPSQPNAFHLLVHVPDGIVRAAVCFGYTSTLVGAALPAFLTGAQCFVGLLAAYGLAELYCYILAWLLAPPTRVREAMEAALRACDGGRCVWHGLYCTNGRSFQLTSEDATRVLAVVRRGRLLATAEPRYLRTVVVSDLNLTLSLEPYEAEEDVEEDEEAEDEEDEETDDADEESDEESGD